MHLSNACMQSWTKHNPWMKPLRYLLSQVWHNALHVCVCVCVCECMFICVYVVLILSYIFVPLAACDPEHHAISSSTTITLKSLGEDSPARPLKSSKLAAAQLLNLTELLPIPTSYFGHQLLVVGSFPGFQQHPAPCLPSHYVQRQPDPGLSYLTNSTM